MHVDSLLCGAILAQMGLFHLPVHHLGQVDRGFILMTVFEQHWRFTLSPPTPLFQSQDFGGNPLIATYNGRMNWRDIAAALGAPLKACFDLTLQERRFLLGLLLIFCLGLGARWHHLRSERPGLYTPPQEQQP